MGLPVRLSCSCSVADERNGSPTALTQSLKQSRHTLQCGVVVQ
jgi:hypothetical protein